MDSLLRIGDGSDVDDDEGIPGLSIGPTVPTTTNKVLCGICNKQFSKYTCPRCQVRYCSLACYKGDGHAECSEGFYKEEFLDTMKNKVADPREQQAMAGVLQRFEEEAAEDASEADLAVARESLEQRIKGLDLDSEADLEIIWKRLTPQEQAEFQNRQKHASLLVEWVPWWMSDIDGDTQLIEQIEEGVGDGNEDGDIVARREAAEVPALEVDVPKFQTMLKGKQPAKELIYNILDLVYVYVYVCRRYNGEVDHMFTTQECAEALLSISPVLGGKASYDSTSSAIQTVFGAIQNDAHVFVSTEYSVELLSDVLSVINKDTKVAAALSHLYRIFSQAAAESKVALMAPKLKETRKRIKLAAKKILFFISWWYWLCAESSIDSEQDTSEVSSENMASSLLSVLQLEIKNERRLVSQDLSEVLTGKQSLETKWKGPKPAPKTPLIQEL